MTESTDRPEAAPSEIDRRRSSRFRFIVLTVTLVAAAVGAAIVFTQVGKDETTTDSVTATLRVDGLPNGLAAGPDALWVALNDHVGGFDAKLERVNLTSGAVEQSVPLKGVLSEVRKIGDSLWAELLGDWLDRKPGELVRLDWRNGEVRGRLSFDRTPYGFAAGDGSLWVIVGRNPAMLVRINPVTRERIGNAVRISANRVIGLEFSGGAVWASAFEDGVLARFDPATGRVDKVRVGENPVAIAIADGDVWVANRASGTVSRVDPATMRVVDTVDAGTYPTWMVSAGDSLWVANQGDGTVTRIDAQTGDVVGAPIRIASPVDTGAAHVEAVERDSLWVTSMTEQTVSRIDTTRRP